MKNEPFFAVIMIFPLFFYSFLKSNDRGISKSSICILLSLSCTLLDFFNINRRDLVQMISLGTFALAAIMVIGAGSISPFDKNEGF